MKINRDGRNIVSLPGILATSKQATAKWKCGGTSIIVPLSRCAIQIVLIHGAGLVSVMDASNNQGAQGNLQLDHPLFLLLYLKRVERGNSVIPRWQEL